MCINLHHRFIISIESVFRMVVQLPRKGTLLENEAFRFNNKPTIMLISAKLFLTSFPFNTRVCSRLLFVCFWTSFLSVYHPVQVHSLWNTGHQKILLHCFQKMLPVFKKKKKTFLEIILCHSHLKTLYFQVNVRSQSSSFTYLWYKYSHCKTDFCLYSL